MYIFYFLLLYPLHSFTDYVKTERLIFNANYNWRASVASETVLGVDNAKSGICYIYIYMYVCMDGTYAL